MSLQELEVVCLYHRDCFDGLGAAWAVYKRYPQGRYVAVDYNDPVPEGLSGKHVIVVDFSFGKELDDALKTMQDIARTAARLTFLDHHERSEQIASVLTYLAMVENLDIEAYYDAERSGATMAWDHFHPFKARPRILEHIADRDLWHFALPHTKEIMSGMGMYPLDLEAWDQVLSSVDHWNSVESDTFLQDLQVSGRVIAIKNRTDVDRIIKQTRRTIELDGVEVPLINVPRSLGSEALALLAQDHEFAAGYYDEANRRVFSLRSRANGGRIVNKIARLFGGDGHPHAAGFHVPRDHPLANY